jgi:dolichol-phosphate mannosyltransferase
MLPAVRATVVIPTYQEAANIATLLRRIRVAAPAVHVLVVDDGSPDGTADLAEAVTAQVGQIQVLRRASKQGLASAYQAGFARAIDDGAEIVITMDADHSHDPIVIPLLVEAAEQGADLVIGSRYIPGGQIVDWTRSRRVLSLWGNRYATSALRLPIQDATSGYRAYRADVVSVDDLSQIRASGYGFLIEMAYRLAREGRKLVEVPITFADRKHGTSKISSHTVFEAAALVSLWGARDLIAERHARRLVEPRATRPPLASARLIGTTLPVARAGKSRRRAG